MERVVYAGMSRTKICPICRKTITKEQEEYTVDVWNGNPDDAYEIFFHEYCVYKTLVDIAQDYQAEFDYYGEEANEKRL